ncbi:glycosyltransferase [Pseudomonas anatoliensis]|uniref:rhamnosyltransferase WsaF family glycosyltransferase n=1 Tax=Pseudomonas anatoliensis TaxID=2710589 RepID=UPI001B33BD12|nr:glycosyltransferase [Pseudomonas anatoliensis]MBP5955743.1 glycosyltransferase [Pseudomonas anatoliensis]
MLQAPTVSVILTSFNHSKYLRAAIESVLNQTYENFELIIWDDASQDESWEIINSYADARIKPFRNSKSKRGVYGINKAIADVAQGEYIAIHHSDDVWEADKLAKQIGFLNTHPSVGAVFSNARAIDEDGAIHPDTSHYYSSVFDRENRSRQEWLRLFFDQGNALCHPSVLIRRQCYDDCGLYRLGLAQLADFDMWIRLCLKYEIHVLPEKLVKFRVRDNEANSSGNRPETRARVLFEFSMLLPLYGQITDKDDLLKVFPEAEAFLSEEGTCVHYAMARAMLEVKTFDIVVPFALTDLFKILNSPDKKVPAEFSVTEFVRLTAELDPLKMGHFDHLAKVAAEHEAEVYKRDEHLAECGIVISERESQIKEISIALSKREAQVAELDALLLEQQAKITDRDSQLTHREQQIIERDEMIAQRDAQIVEFSAVISERDALIDGFNAVISERDALINERNAVISERDALINERNAVISERDALRKAMISERDAQIDGFNAVICERDALINERNAVISERDAQIDGFNAVICERDALINERNAVISERDAQIDGFNAVISERDALIKERNAVICERDAQIDRFNAVISERDALINERNAVIWERDVQINERNAVILERDTRIEAIYKSKSWCATKPLRTLSTLFKKRTKQESGKDVMKQQAKISLLYKLIKLSIANPGFFVRNLNMANVRRFFAAVPRHNEETVINLAKDKIEQDKVLARVHQADETSHPGLLKAQALEKCYPGITQPVGLGNIFLLEEKISAPPFVVDPLAPSRVNVLLPQLDPLIMFGGYIACLQFISKIQSEGFQVRILLTESDRFDREAVDSKLASNPALQKAVAAAEVEDITQGTHELVISPGDAFVGYSFWTCIKAHHLAKAIGKEFIFFLQEYEPIFHPHDSLYAIGSYVYRLPHKVIFNTELLADYFRSKQLGVFSRHEGEELEDHYVAFQHALTPTTPPSVEQLAKRETKRLLFYGRPEGHARRNIFEIGILGLKAAIANGVFDSDWEFYGVGTLGPDYDVELGHGRVMKLSGTLPQSDYGKALGEFDIGLSLMLAPHPSILPFEMASAGQVVVTNTYESRTADVLRSISSNIEPCEADPFSIAEALETAVARASDSEARIQGASFDWVRDWDDAFNPQVIDKISRILRA